MRKILILLGMILAAVALAACGSDEGTTTESGANGGAAAEGSEEAGAEGGSEEAGEEGAGGGAAGGGATVEFESPADGGLEYAEDEKTAEAGKVTIEFDNAQTIAHDVAIEDAAGEQVGKTDVVTEETTSTTVDLKPGEYTFYCTIPGHREAGMEGTLVVE